MIAILAMTAFAQVADTSRTITFDDFQSTVMAHHPIAHTARLAARRAALGVALARGAFDPTVGVSLEQKRFKGLGYYDELEVRGSVPTPFGVDLKLGWERADGRIINPERTTPADGLLSVGLSIPLGRRIITDERRTALTQANAVATAADAERRQVTQSLLATSAAAFGAWYAAEQRASIAREGERLAAFRLDAVRRRIAQGDAAAIDSIEARLELRSRAIARVDAETEAANTRTVAATYLWTARGAYRELDAGNVPRIAADATEPPTDSDVATIALRAAREHPLVVRAQARVREQRAGRTLAYQNLLPDASVTLSALEAGRALGDAFSIGDASENHKVSGSAALSLLLTRERARAAIATASLDLAGWDLALAERQVANGVRIAAADWRALALQRAWQAEAVADATTLLAGEQRRFDAGESSLLLVNLRERALIEERTRLARIDGRLVAAEAAFLQASGGVGR